jgi:acetyl-CoA carboxylase biotin carboxyl carrier protein
MQIRAQLTANVLAVPTEVGTDVEEGTTLVVLESMKMEIPVLAPVGGTVRRIDVAPGDTVSEGDLIAEVTPAQG